jgi:hypothetical protein
MSMEGMGMRRGGEGRALRTAGSGMRVHAPLSRCKRSGRAAIQMVAHVARHSSFRASQETELESAELPTWDIFISHASEDKATLVAPLAGALSAFGVNVWFDDFALSIGDSLSRAIDAGLARSSYGLVVLSPSFFAKRWPEYELRGLTAREMLGTKIILPIWHQVTAQDVAKFSPPLADKVAIASDGLSPLQIAVKVIEAIRPDIFTRIQRRLAFRQAERDSPIMPSGPKPLSVGPIRHEKLSDELLQRVRLIRASLLSVYPRTMEFWLDGFRRDSHPSTEVQWWEHLSAALHEFLAMHDDSLSAVERRAAFDYLLHLGLPLAERDTSGRNAHLTQEMTEQLAAMYAAKLPPYEIVERERQATGSPMPSLLVQTLPKEVFDLEHLPGDIPEELIRQLLGTRPRASGDA